MGDIFVHDRQTGITERVSVDSSEAQSNDYSDWPAISSDGRYVAFDSDATNLVSTDTNGAGDVFVRDRQLGTTERVSVGNLTPPDNQADDGSGSPAISGDGRYVAFASGATNLVVGDTNGVGDVFVRDRLSAITIRASINSSTLAQGNHSSSSPAISSDGRFVAFESDADNLVSGDTSSDLTDIFTYNLTSGVTKRVSLSSSGEELLGTSFAATISGDGHYVAFVFDEWGDGENRTKVLLKDRQAGPITSVSGAPNGFPGNPEQASRPSLSGDGRFVSFDSDASNLVDGDTNGTRDIFVHKTDSDPAVVSITHLDPTPTAALTVRFRVTFSEAVTGVDKTDFTLTLTGDIRYPYVSGVSGTGSTRTVTVNTGHQNGTLRLDVVDNDSILDAALNPLGGVGAGNGNFTTGDVYTINKSLVTTTFKSNGANDGWVLESGEDTAVGGSLNYTDVKFYLGDNAQDRQFRSILHFATASLPDTAVITRVTLKIRKYSTVTGTDPFTTHGNILVYIRRTPFSGSNALQLTDFEYPADNGNSPVGTIYNTPASGWYSTQLDSSAFPYINLTAATQFRLSFELDDNDDLGADTIRFYSGNEPIYLSYRPILQVEYLP
jgi:hypothetical protein